MTPLIDNPEGSERGKPGGNDAKSVHERLERHENGGGEPPLTGSLAVPPFRKKRAKRRQNGKLRASGEQTAAAGPEKSRCNKKRSRKTPVLAISDDNRTRPKSVEKQSSTDEFKRHGHPIHGYWKKVPLYAALDLGTNNCRLLIAAPTKPGHFHVVDAFSRIVRLGEGLGRTGRLNENAMERAIEALKVCRLKLDQRKIKRCRLIATEACRSAENGQRFIERAARETGIDLEIIDRETEARLAVAGCGTLVEDDTDAIVVFDIGGGSSEIVLIDRSKKRSPRLAEHIIAWTSLPVGVITLAERFGGENVTADVFEKMKDYVRHLLMHFEGRKKLGALAKSPHFHLLGTSGTVTTLAGIHLELAKYDRRLIDGIWLNNDA